MLVYMLKTRSVNQNLGKLDEANSSDESSSTVFESASAYIFARRAGECRWRLWDSVKRELRHAAALICYISAPGLVLDWGVLLGP